MTSQPPRGWSPGSICVAPPYGIGRIVRSSPGEITIRIETPGYSIEQRTPSSFAAVETEPGQELSLPTSNVRRVCSLGQAGELARVLQTRAPTEPLPADFPDRMAGLREAFKGPLEVSVRWLRRFRASDEPLSFGERRALRVLERLVAAELEHARNT